MSELFLELPLQFDGMRFKTISLADSITSLVTTIVSTPRGSVDCDSFFGTLQLAPDKSLVELGSIKEELARTIKEAIERNEPRLDKINVKVSGGPKPDKSGVAPLRIELTAVIVASGKSFELDKTLSEDYYRTPFPGRVG
jgi:hypothetical protein